MVVQWSRFSHHEGAFWCSALAASAVFFAWGTSESATFFWNEHHFYLKMWLVLFQKQFFWNQKFWKTKRAKISYSWCYDLYNFYKFKSFYLDNYISYPYELTLLWLRPQVSAILRWWIKKILAHRLTLSEKCDFAVSIFFNFVLNFYSCPSVEFFGLIVKGIKRKMYKF